MANKLKVVDINVSEYPQFSQDVRDGLSRLSCKLQVQLAANAAISLADKTMNNPIRAELLFQLDDQIVECVCVITQGANDDSY